MKKPHLPIKQKDFILPEDFVNRILQDSIATFSIKQKVTRLIKAITADWKKFVLESLDYKKQFCVGRERGWVDRNRQKKRNGEKYDKKQFFHFHRDFRRRLDAKKVDYSKYEDMISNLEKLYTLSLEVSLKAAELLEQRLPGKSIKRQIQKSHTRSTHVIRMLFYPKPTVAEFKKEQKTALAQAHFDRNAWTICWIETAPGLHLGLHLDQEHIYQAGQAGFFAGAKLENLTHRTIDMTYHAVLAKKRTSRIAIVAFFHTLLSEVMTKAYIKKRKAELFGLTLK